jgi:hypothetical protein
MMLGQVRGEPSRRKPNRNFLGFELGSGGEVNRPSDQSGVIWTRAKRSDLITVAKYHEDPDKYYDNPWYGPTIQEQLDHPEKRQGGMLNVLWYSPRQAYDSWDEPTKAFHAKVLGHYKKLMASPYPEHKALAALAFTDPDAYVDTLELNSKFDIRAPNAPDTPAPPNDKAISKMSYNGSGSYKKTIIASLRSKLADDKLSP